MKPRRSLLTCGCTATASCERHSLMKQELKRRYGSSAKSSTARENASKPSSSVACAAGTDGPR